MFQKEVALDNPQEVKLSGTRASRAIRLVLSLDELSQLARDTIPRGVNLRLSGSWNKKTLHYIDPVPGDGSPSEAKCEQYLVATYKGIQVLRSVNIHPRIPPESLIGPPNLVQCFRAAKTTDVEDVTRKLNAFREQI